MSFTRSAGNSEEGSLHANKRLLRMNRTSDAGRAGRTIIGRDQEIGVVARALDEARAGRGQLVIVRGATGSGKTRLARETAELAARRGMRAVWPAIAAPEQPGGRWPRRLPASDIVPLVLGRATPDAPLVLILDDLQAADDAMLASLAVATWRLPDIPALVLGTSIEPPPPAEAQQRIAELEEAAVRVRLGPLLIAAVTALAERAGVDAPAPVLERLHVATGGNALLVVETLDALARVGRVVEYEPWPLSGRAVAWMRGRLAALPVASRAAVEAASILGTDSDVATIARVLGDGADPHMALAESLLMSTVNGSGRRRFVPPLARDLVQASLAAARRAELHFRAATILAADDATAPAVLVHRCLAAGAIGDARRTEVHLRRLADLASETRTADPVSARASGSPYLACQGEYWAIGFAERAVRLRERAGLVYLAHLLASPGVDVPALALLGSIRADSVQATAESALAAERARVSVTRRIRDAIDRIAQAHPELGAHLDRTIRTGTRCSYVVDPAVAPRWDVRWSL
jgi:AAA ATPase domain